MMVAPSLQGPRRTPSTPAAAQDARDHVALADAELFEGVGRLVREVLDVGNVKVRSSPASLVQKRPLVGLHGSPLVDDVKPKLKASGTSMVKFSAEVLVGIEFILGQYFFRT
ncbi:MAG: hypothetical protein ACLTS2_13160 [Eggerthella lenta]